MSTFYILKCEMCDNNFKLPSAGLARPYEYVMPEGWITLVQGNPQHVEAQHFCSKACIAKWAGVEPQHTTSPIKIRRFLLVDGETADIVEGVKWGNGRVSLDIEQAKQSKLNLWFYESWDAFKQAHDGSGIQWIDQEVSDGQ